MGCALEKTDLLLLLALLLCNSSALVLPCHCLNGAQCHSNGYCEKGCERGWFGPGCQVGNVAQNKETKQSSTYIAGYEYNSSLAVDGFWPPLQTLGRIEAAYCSHTLEQTVVWWFVVLDTTHSYVITSVTIVNRPEAASARLTNFIIMYSNEVEGDPDPNSGIWHTFAQEKGAVGSNKNYTSSNTTVAKRVAVYMPADDQKNFQRTAVLVLCEVQIYGYQAYDCPNGFTGPGCLLRSCDACDSIDGECTGEFGSCRYDRCPDRSLLAPGCWITLSNYSKVDIRANATCNSLLFSIDLPDTKPNVAASLLRLHVKKYADGQTVLKTTIPVQGTSTAHFKFDDATMYSAYEVSAVPVYCFSNSRCFDATSSGVFSMWTSKREYVFSQINSCVFVHVKSTSPECELPSAIQVTCESKGVENDTVSSLTSTLCGLTKGQEYNCSASAVVNAKTIEKQSAYIKTESLDAFSELKKDMVVVAGSIGATVAVLAVVVLGIIVVVYCRGQRWRSTPAVAQYSKNNAHVTPGTLNATIQPKPYKEQTDHTFMSHHVDHGLSTPSDYATLEFIFN